MFERASVHAGFFEGKKKRERFEHPALEIGWDGIHQVGQEFKDRWFLKEAFDPNSVKGLSHIEENRALQSFFSKVPYYSFNVEGQLHRSAVLGS